MVRPLGQDLRVHQQQSNQKATMAGLPSLATNCKWISDLLCSVPVRMAADGLVRLVHSGTEFPRLKPAFLLNVRVFNGLARLFYRETQV
jgi:hypothetical protein